MLYMNKTLNNKFDKFAGTSRCNLQIMAIDCCLKFKAVQLHSVWSSVATAIEAERHSGDSSCSSS